MNTISFMNLGDLLHNNSSEEVGKCFVLPENTPVNFIPPATSPQKFHSKLPAIHQEIKSFNHKGVFLPLATHLEYLYLEILSFTDRAFNFTLFISTPRASTLTRKKRSTEFNRYRWVIVILYRGRGGRLHCIKYVRSTSEPRRQALLREKVVRRRRRFKYLRETRRHYL